MDMLAFRQAKWNLSIRLGHRLAHGNLDAPLDFPNVLQIGIHPRAVARAQILLEKRDFMRHRIENTGVLFASQNALFRTGTIAEQAFEGHPRVDLRRKRLCWRGPRYRVGVRTAVAPVAVTEIAGILNAELDRRQDCVLPI